MKLLHDHRLSVYFGFWLVRLDTRGRLFTENGDLFSLNGVCWATKAFVAPKWRILGQDGIFCHKIVANEVTSALNSIDF